MRRNILTRDAFIFCLILANRNPKSLNKVGHQWVAKQNLNNTFHQLLLLHLTRDLILDCLYIYIYIYCNN